MTTIILRTASAYLMPLLLLFSVFMLLRGHYEPGGGFVGGLIASIALVVYGYSNGISKIKSFLRFHPGGLIPIGVTLSLFAALIPLFLGKPFMTSVWLDYTVPIIGVPGTTLLFDTGVYFVVVGTTLTIIFSIGEEQGS
ncbi:MAG: Na+/H+ antiporter subunit B [Saprospirales bacterium]|nr:MAG: Na+/H+ antiporter subunit B [Saprospirales bacterium]